MSKVKLTLDIPGINPEPWTAPTIVRGKGGKAVAVKGGRNDAFQRALREQLDDIHVSPIPADIELTVSFFFWRSTEGGNQADATNLLKAAEDALQGRLYDNDRANRHVSACIVEQGPDVEPRILVHVESFTMPELPDPPVKLPTLNATSSASDAREEDRAWRAENDPAEDF